MNKQVVLPITGMTCANCVASIERNIKKVEGVENAHVNLASERATIEFNPSLSKMNDFIFRIERAGYGIATGEANILIRRMSDDNDARGLETIISNLDGIIKTKVNFGTELAIVEYIPTIISSSEIFHEISKAGYEPVKSQGEREDVERLAREREISQQRHY